MEDIRSWIGGFPEELFENQRMIDHVECGNAANGGGYIGRWQERNDARDRDIYKKLTELDLGEDFVVMFLTSRVGRWYAESVGAQGDEYYGNPRKFTSLIGTLVQDGVLKCEYKETE